MNKAIYLGILLTVFLVPVVFCSQTTEVFGLVKIVTASALTSILLLIWFFKMFSGSRLSFGRDRVAGIFTLYIIWASLSLIWAQSRWIGLLTLVHLLSFWFLYLLITNLIREKPQVLVIIKAMVIAGLIACLVDAWFNRGFNVATFRMNHMGTFGHPNFFAQYLILALPLSIGLALLARTKLSRLGWLGVGALLLSYLLLTRTRAAWLALILALALLCIVLIIIYRTRALIGASCVLLVVASLFILPPRTNNLLHLSHDRIAQAVSSPTRGTAAIRILLWKETLAMVRDYPLFGIGVGNFKVKFPLYRTRLEREHSGEGFGFSKAHNEYLQIWAELGMIGLALFGAMLALALRRIRRIMFKGDKEEKIIAFSGLVSVTAAIVHAFFSSNFQIPASAFGFWTILGCLTVLGGGEEKDLTFKLNRRVIKSLLSVLLLASFVLLWVYLGRVLVGDIYHQRGREAKKDGRIENAVILTIKAVQWNPADPKAAFLLGTLCYHTRRFDLAEQAYYSARLHYPNHDLIWNNLGVLYIALGRYDDARHALERALEINPDNPLTHRNINIFDNI